MAQSDNEMRERLLQAVSKYEDMRRRMRARRVRALDVLERMPLLAQELGYDVREMSVSYKICGSRKDRAIYVSRRGARVDLSGFTLDGPAFSSVAREEARRRHMGRVQARLSLDLPDDEIVSAYVAALEQLG